MENEKVAGEEMRLMMIKALKTKLQKDGLEVLANHSEWLDGKPQAVSGVAPDVVGIRGQQRYTFLVEDESCFVRINKLNQRLSALLQETHDNVYLVIPMEIIWQGRMVDLVRHMRERMQQWGFPIKIASFDFKTQNFNFNPWKSHNF